MVMMKIQLWVAIIIHVIVLLCNLIALVSLPVMLPLEFGWLGVWLSFPICSFIVRLAIVDRKCPLTDWENYLRRRLGMRPIGTFVGHYVKRNIYYKLIKKHDRKIESSQYSLLATNTQK